ncbi:MAG TPA: hypothetical protein PKE26_02040 [Kiritimatiellia bacterium]|nr:hypothetical protein [Kiritimatiellia bacterium]HMO51444.1 hypothetical protein [Kiritimatiellia bacterium]HMO97869.1 hypothetical protein [Kiritimatiellia bacterium]HMP97301.1 hypothetical protein [Kiritimatiellia bacterium]
MNENNKPSTKNAADNKISLIIKWGLLGIAGTSLIFAILRMMIPTRVDKDTALFLGIAAISLVLRQITKFKGFGIEFEKQVAELKEEMSNVQSSVNALEKDVGPGSKTARISTPKSSKPQRMRAGRAKRLIDPDDPNKGMFGGSAEVNGRKLSAAIKPIHGPRSSKCWVEFKVVSTDSSRPLQEPVKVHLHPSFGDWDEYDLEVEKGIATDNIESYGAFTIGIETDDGNTRLELDLMDVKGGTESFYKE